MGRRSLVWFFIVLSTMAFGAGPVLGASYEKCMTTRCSDQGPNISYPFYSSGNDLCGYPGFEIECETNGTTSFGGYVVQNISYGNSLLHVMNKDAIDRFCIGHEPKRPYSIFDNTFLQRRTNDSLCFFYNCKNSSSDHPKSVKSCYSNSTFIALVQPNYTEATKTLQCKWFELLPVDLRDGDRNKEVDELDYRRLLEDGITLDWTKLLTVSSCHGCQQSGGRCGRLVIVDFVCFCPDGTSHHDNCNHGRSHKLKIGLGVVFGGLAVVLSLLSFSIYFKKKYATKRCSSARSSDIEDRCVYFEVPIFTSRELEEATDNFSPSNKLGAGGFGTVYYGKLRDGREVAVKRSVEHNSRRVKHFMNEVKILTRLRHKNLVTLYGCTSSHSNELLLVYEYVVNGTLASHFGGEQSQAGQPLSWHLRMSIAQQTATALTFLHASEVVHRDVKTNNILLDKNFVVKVGDFGISRLFPNDVTHVSTTPQGTPGYVDPEYHQCYQLTEKSDVYSFGVVLMELVSSKPAVDLSRDKHEINLVNFAINRIKRHALNELIDPALGSESDPEILRMMTLVAELAFRCLQPEKEWRPTMVEVLAELKAIGENNGNKATNINEDALLLKRIHSTRSPDSVTQKWPSRSNSSAPLPCDTKVVHKSPPQHSA